LTISSKEDRLTLSGYFQVVEQAGMRLSSFFRNPGRLNFWSILSLTLLLHGCASRPINDPIDQVDADKGYRPAVMMSARAHKNDPSTLFVLSFSGGGTRAAALSYGVLEELNRYRFEAEEGQRQLLDEIDLITGVSGGSFTALSYALYGSRLFDEYETRFLKRDVQGALLKRSLLYPSNWFKQMSGKYGRSEVAAEYYDEILFEGAVFNDLIDAGGPIAIATSTALSTGARLAFFQNDFDLICSDLGTVRLSRAAATSSAVPVALSPVTLNNYGGSCHYQYPAWVRDAIGADEETGAHARARARYNEMREFQDSSAHPYIHLVDGGVADNLGVRGVLEALEELSFSGRFRQQSGYGGIRQIILIVVNAESDKPNDWDKKESPPNSIRQTLQSSGVPISRYTFETVELMKQLVADASWRRQLEIAEARLAGASKQDAEAQFPKVSMLVFDISFRAIDDDAERRYFQSLPTSFSLPDEAVDRLREIGGVLLRQSPVYQEILDRIGAVPKP
jgi:NTE family protein